MNKVDIGYNLVGEGPQKVIALHSWMDDAESWNTAIPFINSEAFTYAFMDVRGYGESKNIKGVFNSEEIVNDIFNLADRLGWGSFHLIGHSMCGLVAQKAALLDETNRIKKIALVTPVSAGGFPADADTLSFFKSIVQNEEVASMAYGVFTSNRPSIHWKNRRANSTMPKRKWRALGSAPKRSRPNSSGRTMTLPRPRRNLRRRILRTQILTTGSPTVWSCNHSARL